MNDINFDEIPGFDIEVSARTPEAELQLETLWVFYKAD